MNHEQLLALIRDKSTIPPRRASCSSGSRFPARSARRSSGSWPSLVASGDLDQTRGNRFGLPDQMNLVVGTHHDPPGGLRLRRPGPAARGRGRGHLHRRQQPQRSDARRPRRRPHRAHHGRRRAEGRIIRILERGNEHDRRPLRPRRRRAWATSCRSIAACSWTSRSRRAGRRRAEPGDMVIVEITRWPTADARRRSAASSRCSATSTRPASTPRSSSASTASPTRTRDEAVDEATRLGAAVARARHPRPHRLPRRCRPSPSTASTRATSTTRSRSSGCRTATTGSACTSPTSSHYVQEGSALDRGGLRARHVGVLPRARRAHVPVGAGDRAVQPESARRSAGAVVPDGGRSRAATVVRYEFHDGVINSDARMTYTASTPS